MIGVKGRVPIISLVIRLSWGRGLEGIGVLHYTLLLCIHRCCYILCCILCFPTTATTTTTTTTKYVNIYLLAPIMMYFRRRYSTLRDLVYQVRQDTAPRTGRHAHSPPFMICHHLLVILLLLLFPFVSWSTYLPTSYLHKGM